MSRKNWLVPHPCLRYLTYPKTSLDTFSLSLGHESGLSSQQLSLTSPQVVQLGDMEDHRLWSSPVHLVLKGPQVLGLDLSRLLEAVEALWVR